MNIEYWRNEIDDVDRELLQLLNRRARLAMKVGERTRLRLSPNTSRLPGRCVVWTPTGIGKVRGSITVSEIALATKNQSLPWRPSAR